MDYDSQIKRPTGSAVREPLSHALGTRGKVASLRVLCPIAEPVTQREVARRAHFQHRTIQLALEELVVLGLVHRVEGGRDFLVSLNPRHRLVPALRDLFRLEAEHFLELRRRLAEIMAAGPRRSAPLAAVLFGSVARAQDEPTSDFDLLIVARDQTGTSASVDRVQTAAGDLAARFGVRVRPIGYTLAEARRLWLQKRPPLNEIVRDGLVLVGPPLPDLLRQVPEGR